MEEKWVFNAFYTYIYTYMYMYVRIFMTLIYLYLIKIQCQFNLTTRSRNKTFNFHFFIFLFICSVFHTFYTWVNFTSDCRTAIYRRIIRKGQIFEFIRTSASHLHTMRVAYPDQQHVGGEISPLLNIPSPVNYNIRTYLNIIFIFNGF